MLLHCCDHVLLGDHIFGNERIGSAGVPNGNIIPPRKTHIFQLLKYLTGFFVYLPPVYILLLPLAGGGMLEGNFLPYVVLLQ